MRHALWGRLGSYSPTALASPSPRTPAPLCQARDQDHKSPPFPPQVFNFDHSFWSANKDDDHFADQAEVFEKLGTDVLGNAFDGYNACIFAYGQTGRSARSRRRPARVFSRPP